MTEQIPKASLMVKSLCGNSRKKFSLEKQQFYCWFILESFKKIEIRAPNGNLIVYIIWNTAHHLNLNSNYCQRKITIYIRYCERIVISVYLCRCCCCWCYLMLPLYTHTLFASLGQWNMIGWVRCNFWTINHVSVIIFVLLAFLELLSFSSFPINLIKMSNKEPEILERNIYYRMFRRWNVPINCRY